MQKEGKNCLPTLYLPATILQCGGETWKLRQCCSLPTPRSTYLSHKLIVTSLQNLTTLSQQKFSKIEFLGQITKSLVYLIYLH